MFKTRQVSLLQCYKYFCSVNCGNESACRCGPTCPADTPCVKGESPLLGWITRWRTGEVPASSVTRQMDTWAAVLTSPICPDLRTQSAWLSLQLHETHGWCHLYTSSAPRRSGTCMHHDAASVASVCCWLRCRGGDVLTLPCFANSWARGWLEGSKTRRDSY